MTAAQVPRRRMRRDLPVLIRRSAARQRALSALSRRFPAEFTVLYEAEIVRAGLWPVPGHTPRIRVAARGSKGLQSW